MNSTQQRFCKRASVIAVHGALAALAAMPLLARAQMSEEVLELTQPTSKVEVGIGYVDKDSAKFGEYNGLSDKGVYGIGNLDLRGGGGPESAFRWRLTGDSLGLDTRSFGAEVGEQGRYRINLGYDELRREYTDSFSTIFRGTGTTTLRLPAAYPAAATRLSATTNANQALSNWANFQSPFATVACAAANNRAGACAGPGVLIPATMVNPGDLATERKGANLGLSYFLTPELEFRAKARREEKEGVKLTGFGMNGPGRGLMLPEPIDSVTNNYEAGISYTTRQGFINFSYAGSTYTNHINRWTVENPFQNNSLLNNVAQLSGAPDNQMHQFNLSGGMNFTRTTKLVLAGSHTRMTQNESFDATYPSPAYLIPERSAQAKVVNTSFTARLSMRPVQTLSLTAGFKYDNRENNTPSHLFLVPSADNGAATSYRTFVNHPYDRRNQRFHVDGDLAVTATGNLGFGYEFQDLRHTAHGDLPMPSSGNKEDTVRLEFRQGLGDVMNAQVGYSFARRKMRDHYHEGDPLPVTPVVPEDVAPLLAAGKVTFAGGVFTAVAPYTFPAADPLMRGFRQFFLADRERDKARGAVNFQITPKLTLDTIVEYSRDRYENSPYGLKNAENLSLTFDGSFAPSEKLSFSAFYTYEDIKASMDQQAILRGVAANPEVAGSTGTTLIAANTATNCVGSTLPTGTPANYWLDPCRRWGMEQRDKIHTVGVGVRTKGWLGGKLDLSGDLAYSHARTPISMSGGTYTSNGTLNVYYSAQDLPDITAKMFDLRLSGTYALDKKSSLRLNYLGRRLRSNDFQYDAYTNPVFSQSYMGIGMTSPNYTVHALGFSYIYTFR